MNMAPAIHACSRRSVAHAAADRPLQAKAARVRLVLSPGAPGLRQTTSRTSPRDRLSGEIGEAATGPSGPRCSLSFVLALFLVAGPVCAQTKIHALTEVIDGHSVGGVTIDLVGNLYIADFGDLVWKITPDGERRVFASGLYGASGNAIDHRGNLLQSSCYGNTITRIDRNGHAVPFADSGLNCPIGIAVNKRTHDAYVANCSGNSVVKVATDGTVTAFAKSDLFNCPNGVAFDREDNLYVVNFRDNMMLKIDAQGAVAPFAKVSKRGLGHLCLGKDRFYVTASASHEIYEVTLDGKPKRILGNGQRGVVDGAIEEARLSFPNGVACHPWTGRLFINEFVNDTVSSPPRAVIREIVLDASQPP